MAGAARAARSGAPEPRIRERSEKAQSGLTTAVLYSDTNIDKRFDHIE
jgi:hypothetical protein